jgi:hypothetical protein
MGHKCHYLLGVYNGIYCDYRAARLRWAAVFRIILHFRGWIILIHKKNDQASTDYRLMCIYIYINMVVEYIYINMVVLDGDVLQLARDLQRPLSPLGCPTAGRPT